MLSHLYPMISLKPPAVFRGRVDTARGAHHERTGMAGPLQGADLGGEVGGGAQERVGGERGAPAECGGLAAGRPQ